MWMQVIAKCRREKLWAKHSQRIPKPIFEMLLIVMREATQQQSAMNLECSASVYKHLDAALKSARDAMACELQQMQTDRIVEVVFGATKQPMCLSGDHPDPSNCVNTEEEAQEEESDSGDSLLEGSSRKRHGGSGQENRMGLKRMRLAIPDAHKAEQ